MKLIVYDKIKNIILASKNKFGINYSLYVSIFLLIFITLFADINKNIIYISRYEKKRIFQKLKEINKWIYLCQKKILIRGILNSSTQPKITALITLYNSNSYIDTAVKSVQNQNFPDIEILMVDDASTDDSPNIIKNLQNEDKRIKIIKNKKNRGALYSKSIGILKASGMYTMILDSDDLFSNDNIFSICFDEAIKNNIDLIEFSGFNLNSEYFQLRTIPEIPYYLRFKKKNEKVLQPELSSYIYRKLGKGNYKLIDGVLWGKCIKSAIFKMSLKIVGSNIYRQKINYGDDRIINFILFKVANSFKYIHEYGIIYNYNNNSITHLNSYIQNCQDELVNLISIYNFTKNTKEIDIAAFEVVYRWDTIIFPGLNSDNFKSMKKLLNKYICNENKLKLLSFSSNLTKSKMLKLFEFL